MPQVKKQSRPRLDAIVRHIKAGSYDDDMEALKGAIDERNKSRQEAVMKVVKQVFGEKARVETDEPLIHPAHPAATARRPRPGGPPSSDPELAAAEEAALAHERELEAELNGEPAADSEDPEAEIISNSPIIGGVE